MAGKKNRSRFSCQNPPCIHVVRDERRKIFAVFIELDPENIYVVGAGELEKACRIMEDVKRDHLREARLEEIDYLATRYLGAAPAPETDLEL